MNELRVKRQSNKGTGLLTKALTDDTDKQNKQIFLLTTHRDLKVVELTELVDEWTGRQVVYLE